MRGRGRLGLCRNRDLPLLQHASWNKYLNLLIHLFWEGMQIKFWYWAITRLQERIIRTWLHLNLRWWRSRRNKLIWVSILLKLQYRKPKLRCCLLRGQEKPPLRWILHLINLHGLCLNHFRQRREMMGMLLNQQSSHRSSLPPKPKPQFCSKNVKKSKDWSLPLSRISQMKKMMILDLPNKVEP